MKLLIVSDLSPFALANSYIRAIKNDFPAINLLTFDILHEQKKYIKIKPFGTYFHRFVRIEAWIRKVNRELSVFIRKNKPDLIFVFGNSPVQYSTYAFIKSLFDIPVVLYWPDTLTNLEQNQYNIAPFIDILFSYSNTIQKSFQLMGYKKTCFLPFAFDPYYMDKKDDKISPVNFTYDISFIGGHRPEREEVMSEIVRQFPSLNIKIRGPYWMRDLKDKKLKKYITEKPLFGKQYADFFRTSRININIIDDTNYPGANMRFFEIMGAGGLQLSSSCPEMESIFIDKQDIVYFHSKQSLIEKIDYILNSPNIEKQIRENGYKKVQNNHTYKHRTETLLNQLNITL
jgi:spore maturation protein CgeB